MKLIAEITDKEILGTDGLSSSKPRYTVTETLFTRNKETARLLVEVIVFATFIINPFYYKRVIMPQYLLTL